MWKTKDSIDDVRIDSEKALERDYFMTGKL